jgi:hypothetical protein
VTVRTRWLTIGKRARSKAGRWVPFSLLFDSARIFSTLAHRDGLSLHELLHTQSSSPLACLMRPQSPNRPKDMQT